MAFRLLDPRLRLYIVANLLLGSAVWCIALEHGRLRWDLPILLIIAFTLASSLLNVILPDKSGRMTLSYTVVFLTVLLRREAIDAVVVASLGGLLGTVAVRLMPRPDGTPPRRTWYKPALTVANLSYSAFAASLIWNHLWLGVGGTSPLWLVKLILVVGSYFVMNTGGIAAAAALALGEPFRVIWRQNYLWTLPGYLCAISAAAGTILLFDRLQWASFILIPPVYLVYYFYQLYMDKIQAELKHVRELNDLNSRVISTLAMTIEAKDRYTHKHVERVREYALGIARILGVSEQEEQAVRIGAMVHDIGKIAVPEAILTKPTKLTHDEFERMKSHVLVGVKILEAVNFPFPVTDAVIAHHERWDGNGYPHGLKGDEIPMVGRIVALADSFDALTSDRPYRSRLSDEDAIALVNAASGEHFDPAVVQALIQSLPEVRPVIDLLNQQEWNDSDLSGQRRMVPQEALEEIARVAEEGVAITELALQPNLSHDPEEVFRLLLKKAMQLLPAATGAVFLLDPDAREVQAQACAGMYEDLVQDLTMKTGEGISGWVVSTGQTALNQPATSDLARRVLPGQNLELNSTLSVPLQVGGTCVGAITLYHTGYNLYTPHHERLLITLADHASGAVDTLSRLKMNHHLALTDSLTDLPNIRFLIQHIERLIAEDPGPFSILMLDLNGFKQINDTLGHLEGDRVLRDTAALLREAIRNEDVVGRYAGDEFVIICHTPDRRDAEALADRIDRGFREYGRSHSGQIALSTSIGNASYPGDGLDWRTLFSTADRRMYAQKLTGKDASLRESSPAASPRAGANRSPKWPASGAAGDRPPVGAHPSV